MIRTGYDRAARRTAHAVARQHRVPRTLPATTRRRDRHRNTEGRLQPRIRLLHRDHARAPGRRTASRLRTQADHQERRALRHRRTAATRDQDPQGRGERQGTRVRDVPEALRDQVAAAVESLQSTAHAVADLDVLHFAGYRRDRTRLLPPNARQTRAPCDSRMRAIRSSKSPTPPGRSSPTTPTWSRRSAAWCC